MVQASFSIGGIAMGFVRKSLGVALCTMLASAAIAQPQELERYIVVMIPGAGVPVDVAADIGARSSGRVGYIYEHAIDGFSITVPRTALAGIERDPRVAYVEKDTPVSIVAQSMPTGLPRIDAEANAWLDIDGIDDQRVDADVAVLDTGIDRQHPDLNVVSGANCLQSTGNGPPWARGYYCDGTMDGDDDHYHGTHVAGTIGALDNGIGVVGVAPGVNLHAVKVLDSGGSGYTSGIIAGIEWVVAHGGIDVLNMSLGGSGRNTAYQDAIDNAVAAGVTVVVAAGNSDVDANDYSPAFVPSALTVSALADFDGETGGLVTNTSSYCRNDQDDTLADFSNWGSAVDIAAPGVCILSTFPLEQGEYGTISGTSMAAPHVAGAAAILASNGSDPSTIATTLLGTGNFDWTDDSGDGSQEPLLNVATFSATMVAGGGEGGGGDPNVPPTAAFSFNCTDLYCEFDASGSSNGDGTITAYDWNFGDGASDSGVTASRAYATEGTYTVTLTVIEDDQNDAATDVQDVAVSSAGDGDGGALLSSSVSNGSTWTANVWRDGNSPFSGTWSTEDSCSEKTTCTLSGIRKRVSSVTFTSEQGEQIVVLKP
jgi:hypothetical protein